GRTDAIPSRIERRERENTAFGGERLARPPEHGDHRVAKRNARLAAHDVPDQQRGRSLGAGDPEGAEHDPGGDRTSDARSCEPDDGGGRSHVPSTHCRRRRGPPRHFRRWRPISSGTHGGTAAGATCNNAANDARVNALALRCRVNQIPSHTLFIVRGGRLVARMTGWTWLRASVVALVPAPLAAQGSTSSFKVEETTISAVHAAFKAKTLTCHALVGKYLARIAAYDKQGPAINALVTLNPNALVIADSLDRRFAKEGLTGPLHCVPMIVKDNFETKDLQTTAGSLALKGWVPRQDATMVARIR